MKSALPLSGYADLSRGLSFPICNQGVLRMPSWGWFLSFPWDFTRLTSIRHLASTGCPRVCSFLSACSGQTGARDVNGYDVKVLLCPRQALWGGHFLVRVCVVGVEGVELHAAHVGTPGVMSTCCREVTAGGDRGGSGGFCMSCSSCEECLSQPGE